MSNLKKQRAEEFLRCLGNGKSIYEIESQDEGQEDDTNGKNKTNT